MGQSRIWGHMCSKEECAHLDIQITSLTKPLCSASYPNICHSVFFEDILSLQCMSTPHAAGLNTTPGRSIAHAVQAAIVKALLSTSTTVPWYNTYPVNQEDVYATMTSCNICTICTIVLTFCSCALCDCLCGMRTKVLECTWF